MYCPQCANRIQDGSTFCTKCGQQAGATPAKAKKTAVSNDFIAGIILLLFVFVAVVYFAGQLDQSSTWNFGSDHHVGAGQQQAKLYTQTVDPAFTVPQHGDKPYRIDVPAGAGSARLQGHFSATGGSGNDIEVWLMNDDEFANWRNRHPVTPLYNSQKVTQGTISVSLPSAGTYYLVFNNKFSPISPKAVQDNLTLQYVK